MKANPEKIWKRKLGLILCHQSEGLEGVYKNLLLLAQSRRELGRLMNQLPPHCRLELELLIELEIVWQHIQENREASIKWLLGIPENSQGLQEHYQMLLNQNRDWYPYDNCDYGPSVEPPDDRHCYIRFEGSEEKFSFTLKRKIDKQGVFFVSIDSGFLTEKRTHVLRSLPRSFKRAHDPYEAYFVFRVFGIRLSRLVKDAYDTSGWTDPGLEQVRIKKQGATGQHYLEMKPGFLAELASKLKKQGVLVKDIFTE